MVHCALGPEQGEAEWDAWYAGMKPPSLLLGVPGFRAAQRFKGTRTPPAYLAVYTVDNAEVLTSSAYRDAGGGNFLTDRWKPQISFWHRSLFEGGKVPAVAAEETLLVLDAAAPEDPPGLDFVWVKAAGLDRPTPWRGLAAVTREAALEAVARLPATAAYVPRMPRLVA